MLPLLILAAVAVPMLEIAVLSQILVWAPWPLVLALVVVGSVAGLVIMRQDGLSGLRRWRSARRRRSPADARTIAAGLRDVAAILLAVPGVVTTVCGLVLLAPPLRAFVGRRATAADTARRRRRLPAIEAGRTPALAPPPPRPALAPAVVGQHDEFTGEQFAFAHASAATGHIAGQSEAHGAVVDTFFDPAPTPTAPEAGPMIPMAPPLPPVLAPPSQSTTISPMPAAPQPPQATGGGGRSEPAGDEAGWGAFMEGSDWEEAPVRRRRERRSAKAATQPGGHRRARRGRPNPPQEEQR